MIFLGLWAFQGDPRHQVAQNPPTLKTDRLVKRLLSRDLTLARTKTAGESWSSSPAWPRTCTTRRGRCPAWPGADDLKQLADLYQQIVEEVVLRRAPKDLRPLAEKDRQQYVGRLTETLREEERRARARALEVPAAARPYLEQMAEAARKGVQALQELPRGDAQ